MCGIAGIMMRGDYTPAHATLEALAHALQHRGPDGHGFFVQNQVALVHTRLSIIDLAHGQQPLLDHKGRALVVNGEIYNNPELRQVFSSYPYKTLSDSEIVFPACDRYGMDFMKPLRGMYAIALYDPNSGDLLLGRDPYGIKPLYYVENERFFAFASEPKALRHAHLAPAGLESQGIKELLQLRFTTGQETIYPTINRLMPGEVLRLRQGYIVERSLHPGLIAHQLSDPYYPLDDLDTLLSDSVRIHLRSDVPYGLFLSGGIDSAAVLALIRRHHTGTLKTFSIGFPGTQMHDERGQARKMADAVDAEHHDVDFTENDFWSLLPQVAYHLDDPVLDYAALPTFKLAKIASEAVKVVLCGEGGDEVFAGYRRYQRARRPSWLGGRLWRKKGLIQEQDLFTFDLAGWDAKILATEQYVSARTMTSVQRAQEIDFHHWLPNDLLTKLDRCLMAHGVEGRTPFVDRDVVSFGFLLPDHHKLHWGKGKWIVRQWLDKYFPVAQPFAKKRGFNVPVNEWIIRQASLLSTLIPHQPGILELCDPRKVESFFQNLTSEHALTAWALLFYSIWHKVHVLGASPSVSTFEILKN